MKLKEIEPEHQELFLAIGKQIRNLRKSKNMSYIEISERINISRNSYNQLELGISNFRFLTLLAVLKYYEIDISDFFKEI